MASKQDNSVWMENQRASQKSTESDNKSERERGVGEALTHMSQSQVSFLLKVWSINQQRQHHLET